MAGYPLESKVLWLWMERWLETCEKHVPDVGLSLQLISADLS